MARSAENFSFVTKRLDTGLVFVEVGGYMDTNSPKGKAYLAQLKDLIERVQQTDKQQVGLIFKDSLTGFDAGTAARTHGELFRDLGDSVLAVAIVSSKLRMRFGVAGAKLFAKQPIEIFTDENEARSWLRSKPR